MNKSGTSSFICRYDLLLTLKSLTNFNIQKFVSIIKPREIGEPPSATYTLIYNPPRRVAPWSIESPIYARQGGVLLYTFSTLFFCPKSACPCLCEKKGFSLFAKTFFGTEVGVLRSKFFFREQLVLYTGFICSATSVRSIF